MAQFGATGNIDIEEVIEQTTTYRSIQCYTNTARVNKLVIKQNRDMGKQRIKSQNLRTEQLK